MLAFLQRLSAREKVLVSGTAIFVAVALLYGLFLGPVMESRARWRSMADRKAEELEHFRNLSLRYQDLDSNLADYERRITASGTGTSLLARLEAVARRLGLQERITSMKPATAQLDSGIAEMSVELKMEKMDLKGLVDFLAEVEREEEGVKTGRLRIKKRFDDPQLLDVTLTVSALEGR